MAFDIGLHLEPTPSSPVSPEKRTAEDVLDLVLRIIVIVPLLALYTWWVASTIWQGLKALAGG